MSNAKRDLSIVEGFKSETGLNVKHDLTGKRSTTFCIGGRFEHFVTVESEEQLKSALNFLNKHDQPYKILGAGSNLLVADCGVSGWVIKAGRGLRFTRNISSTTLEVGAAMALMPLSRALCEQGLSGLEFAGGIPASVGGAVRMNAGAHGGEIADLVERVKFIDGHGVSHNLDSSQLEFNYRRSCLPPDAFIVSVELKLIQSDPQSVSKRRVHCLEQRKAHQPLTQPSAGSVFRNPAGDLTAGQLIEKCDLKGTACGGAEVSKKHGNWIVNPAKQATCHDVLELVKDCQSQVNHKFKIGLTPELVVWGE